MHTRSTVAEGVFDTYVPASQVTQVMHAAALAVVLNEPAAHVVHVRLLVGVLSAVTKVPGAHTLTGAQAVAGLASWSQVPDAQVVCGLIPPAQNCPATHASQTAALVAVPSAVCTVPAAQLP